jgi:hypothetical protein
MSHLSEEQLDQVIAAERSREQAPLNEWRTIAARAREEGLIRESQSSRWWASSQPWLQSAAAILLLVGGIAIGRTTIGLPTTAGSPDTAQASRVGVTPSASTAPSVPATSASGDASFASVDDAAATLHRAVTDYERASQFLAANNTTGESRDSLSMYLDRAAALDKIVNATESALRTAPHDPVINQYYLATMGARAATQQLVAQPVVLRGF